MKKKIIDKTKGNSLSEILNPLMNYLISIENNPVSDTESYLIYTLGVPKNWIMETENIFTDVIRETDTLKLIRLEHNSDNNLSVDEFFDYIVNLVNKNLVIDQKRLELEEEINRLKNKFQVEQQELMNDLFNLENSNMKEDGEESINK
jgi:hypothetical protein